MMNKVFAILLLCAFFVGCTDTSGKAENGIENRDFYKLMNNVSNGWSTQNTELALSSFTKDAVYMQPPDVQFYQGHQQLKAYFGALTEEYKMEFHHLWFDEKSQSGAGEFTFSWGKDTSDVGVIVVQLENGKIAFWREYFIKGPTGFEQFISIENKEWEWHIGNYPEPVDTMGIEGEKQ